MPALIHQEEGSQELVTLLRRHHAAILGDVPGTGKTRTALRAFQRLNIEPLVICPAIVRTHWHREAVALGMTLEHVYSYDQITRGRHDIKHMALRDSGRGLIVDEFHYLKHAASKRTVQILGREGYARQLPTLLLSGTFPPRNAAEMWTVLASLFPRVVAEYGCTTYDQWVAKTCVIRTSFFRGGTREKVVATKPEALPMIREILSRVSLRRTLDELGLDVPELFWQPMVLNAGVIPVGGLDGRTDVVDAVHEGRLADIANDPEVARMRRRLGEYKAPLVIERLRSELASGEEKLAVFAYHTSVLTALSEGLAEFGVAFVDGNVVGNARQNAIDRFQVSRDIRVFIGQNIACQTGVPLSAGRRAVLVEPEWTPDVNYQLGKRIARIGSARGVVVAQMVCLADTLDEAIIAQNIRETRMVEEILT